MRPPLRPATRACDSWTGVMHVLCYFFYCSGGWCVVDALLMGLESAASCVVDVLMGFK